MDETTIVLADGRGVVGSGLRLLLNAVPGLHVVAEAGDAREAKRCALRYRPDVLVLDLRMPGPPALKVVPEIREEVPETGIVVLTTEDETAVVRAALAAGVGGYVLKGAAEAELVRAVRAVARGATYLQPDLAARLDGEQPPPGIELTARERDVLRLIALGHTNTEIAERLYLSVRTVEDHRSRLSHKIGVETRAQLVRFALGRGLGGA